MKTSNINLLDAHLSDRALTFVAQDLLALDVAEKIAEIFGTPTDFIAEARALFARFENEIDAKFASDARLLADHLKTEGMENERTFADVPRTFSNLRFPAPVAPAPVVEAPVVEEAPEAPVVVEAPEAIVSELAVRTYVVEFEGRIIAVHQKNRDFKFCFVQRRPMVDSFNVYNFSATEKLCLRGAKTRWNGSTQNGHVVELKEIFTIAELEEALKAEKAEVQRAKKIWSEIADRNPEIVSVDSWGRKSLKCSLPAEAKIERARQIWEEIKG